ncbi:MAG: DMT family transporter [Cytophagaceae bacterium]|nr:DMT family transporter [Cytophagaceae bacterium]
MPYWFLLLIAVAIGAILPFQAGLNTQLARVAGHPVWSALFSFATGTVVLLLYALLARLPTGQLGALKSVPWYLWLGGILGTVYVATVLLIVPRLGLALSFGLIIGGQILVSLVIDHYGLLGLPVQPVSPGRLLGAILLIVGVALIRRF